MRGDNAPLAEIADDLCGRARPRFRDGVITVMDDSHGIGAYGARGRGTEEYCRARVDILIGTFGKAFGVNGGFVAASAELIEAVRQKADTYIYTNPLGAGDCGGGAAGGRNRRWCRGTRAAEESSGADAAVPGRPPVARPRVDSGAASGGAAARARHGQDARDGHAASLTTASSPSG